MSVRSRSRRTAAAIAVVAGVTAGLSLVLTGCGPEDATGTDGTDPSATSTASPAQGTSGAKGDPAASDAPAAKVNGTGKNGLTISDGSRFVVMNGTRVDFGTVVRDLAWSPDGKKAAFVDGDGDLVVSDPDGGNRTVVAKNPGSENWSHPTWQVRAADTANQLPKLNNLFFAGRKGGVSRLYGVSATAHNGTPHVLSLGNESGEDVKELPQTGNVWPNAAGKYGAAVYANADDGKVYVRDDYLRQQGAAIAPGSEPALAPGDDEGFVFVRSVAGHDHLFRETPGDNGPTFKDLTPNAATDYTEPAFSPDGKTVAARTPAGIVTLPADGSAAPVKISDYTGLPAYRA
ncbi:PD40 domain-containing protein [Streptomyces sp. NRRL F-5123]|uniref:PD40 domain-containing protein n=1 Tax=Streptomyces sp. NRRL F-5123 TaxID=1463856 RepID=UPI00099B67ED|nr:PD40 domain-containing protein [Streptomyces sp. NRRL F-5123]